MTSDDAPVTGGAPGGTSATRWAAQAHRVIEASGRDGLATLLADDFVQESHRGIGFTFDRQALLGTVRSMRELGMHVSGTAIAVAGDRCVLTRRAYQHGSAAAELLAVSVWNEDGRLSRLIEFDVGDLDQALETLGDVAGAPVQVLAEPLQDE
jgi:hypothetical protein